MTERNIDVSEQLVRIDAETWHYSTKGTAKDLSQDVMEAVYGYARHLVLFFAQDGDLTEEMKKERDSYEPIDYEKLGLNKNEIIGVRYRADYLAEVGLGIREVKAK